MYNKVIMMGRIVNDLELRSTTSGASVLSFRIAVDRRFQTKGEERKSDFFNVVAWRNEAEFISRYFSKGRMILIEGELQTRNYQDKNGNTAYITEIIVDRSTFTGEKKESSTSGTAGYTPAPAAVAYNAPTTPIGSTVVTPDDDDDYPF